MSLRYCRCETDPYSGPINWDVWASSDRAFCHSCNLDLRPEVARREYAKACAELERVRVKFPEESAA